MSRCTKCNQHIPTPRVSLDVSEIMEKLRYQYDSNVATLSEVSRIVEDIDKDVVDYQEEIHRLQAHILRLTSKCDRARSMKRTMQGLTSPVRRLPNEILARVFEYLCAENEFRAEHMLDQDGSPSRFERVPALAASAVCSRWRRLALSTPRLWTNFAAELSGDEEDYKGECQLARVINLFLRRSAEHPLSVNLSLPDWNSDCWALDEWEFEDVPAEHPVVSAVLSNAHRLETFGHTAEFPTSSFSHEHWISPPSFPILRRVSILQTSDEAEPMNPVYFFQKAPKLKELAFHGLYDLYEAPGSSSVSRLCSQLTDVDIPTTSPELFKAIGLFTQLSTLRLEVIHDLELDKPDRPEELLVLPTLRSLHMRVTNSPSDRFSDDIVRMILSSLTVPSLEELAIVPKKNHGRFQTLDANDGDYSAPWPGEEIFGLIERSHCTLTKLKLKIRVSGNQLVTLLLHLGSLRELTVDGRHADVNLASSLIPRLHGFNGGSIQPLVPKLSRLSLVIGGTRKENKFDDGKFVSMVVSRWDPGSLCGCDTGLACLRSVSVHFTGMEVDSDAYESLRILERSGLDLMLTGNTPAPA